MQRINSPDGHFHAGDPSSGIKGTMVTRDFMESVQEELAAIPESVGLKLDKADNRQILKAIQKMFADAGSGLRSDVEKRYQLQLGYTPVQQGTGVGQAGNVVKMGWAKDASGLRVTVDAKDLGRVVFEDWLAPYATQEWARKNCLDSIGGKVNRGGDTMTGDLVLAADKGKYSPVLGLSCPGYIAYLQACLDEGGIVAIIDKSGKVRNFVVRDNGTVWVRDTLEAAHLSSRGDVKAANAIYAGDAVLAKDGNIKGSIWGGWLADWLAKKFDARDNRDDFAVAVGQGEGKALYTPTVTRGKGVYLVTPCGAHLDHVGNISTVIAFGEFVQGKGSMGSTTLTLDGRGLFNNCPFVLHVVSDSATIRFGIRVGVMAVADIRRAELKIDGRSAVSFDAKRIC